MTKKRYEMRPRKYLKSYSMFSNAVCYNYKDNNTAYKSKNVTDKQRSRRLRRRGEKRVLNDTRKEI